MSFFIFPPNEKTITPYTSLVNEAFFRTYHGASISQRGPRPTARAHALLSATHPDTEEAAPQIGDMVLASGDAPAPAAAGSPEHELLSEMHDDTVAAAPEAADVIMASGDPVLWRRLAAGAEGQIFEMGGSLPKWGRKITSSDDPPDPEEGSDGDIWLEY